MAINAEIAACRSVLVGGEWKSAEESFEVRSPYSGELLARVSSAAETTLDAAVAAARVAADEMRNTDRFRMAIALRSMSESIKRRADEFAATISDEAGKPIRYARAEVERAIGTFSWAAGEAERFVGEIVPIDTQVSGKGKSGYVVRVPKGIIYGITPFNFPLNLVAHKVAPALASRNAVIIKPSPRTPLSALLLGEIFLDSGLPRSALQIVPMDTKYVDRVLEDERIAMISFTGSSAVGWDLK